MPRLVFLFSALLGMVTLDFECALDGSLARDALDSARDGPCRDIDKDSPLLWLLGRLSWTLARKDRCVFSCGRNDICFATPMGLALPSTQVESHTTWLPSYGLGPLGVEAGIGDDARVMDVKSVPPCEKALDQLSSSIEVCSLKRLPPDARLILCSGLRTLGRRFDVISSGNGGNGCEGARPGSWLYILFDLGTCNVLLTALGSVLLPSGSPAIILWEALRCCPWNKGFGARSGVTEAFVTSQSFPMRSRMPLDDISFFRGVSAGFSMSLEEGEGRPNFDFSDTGVIINDGSLTKGVPSARIIRRGNGQDCCCPTRSFSSRSFACAFGM